MECSGAETAFYSIPTINDCADKCFGLSEMFAYGTNDYGTDRTQTCLCETAAKDGTCDASTHNGYRLYIFTGK